MNFFKQQEKIRRLSRLLSIFFTIAVISIVGTISTGSALAIRFFNPEFSNETMASLIAVLSLLVGATIFGALFFKYRLLSTGSLSIGFDLGGRLLEPSTIVPTEKRLRNIVEEMAIAAELPMVEIFVIDADNTVNAFTAGLTPSNAVIGVTTGALKHLNREELQAIIGHEMAHIKNGDIALALKIFSCVYGLSVVSIIGRTMLRYLSSTSGRVMRRKSLLLIPISFLFWIAGSLGVLFGTIIQATISRQREYLADASSVQFTRNPIGLANALKKIGSLKSRWIHSSPTTFEYRHFFFVSPFSSYGVDFFSSHPPLDRRIRALDPSFDGTYKEAIEIELVSDKSDEIVKQKTNAIDTYTAYQEAISLMATEPQTSKAASLKKMRQILPALRNLSTNQYSQLIQQLKRQAEKDSKLSLYEYAILRMVSDIRRPAEPSRIAHYYSLKKLTPQLDILFSCMAYTSAGTVQGAAALMSDFATKLQLRLHLVSREECTVSALDAAFKSLRFISAKLKEEVIGAVRQMAQSDSVIHDDEAFLIGLMTELCSN